jgi:GT2 family glycosyltransferase
MTSDMPAASIVICTLNRPDDIQKCVQSIARQTCQPAQLVIVDAGDLGSVKDILAGICAESTIEFIYCQDQPSTTKQRNKGASFVCSDVIFFLDDDVVLDERYIESVLKLYRDDATGAIGGITGVQYPPSKASRGFWKLYARIFLLAETVTDQGTRLKPSNFPVHSTGLSDVRTCDFMPSTAVSYRLAIFNQHLFDVDLTGYVMAEDIDLSYRVARESRLLMTPAAVYSHSKSPVARNSIRERERRRLLFTQYFFQKNQADVAWRHLARYWALTGLAFRYLYLGIKTRNMQRFSGLCDGLRCISRNRLFWHRNFAQGPLQHNNR